MENEKKGFKNRIPEREKRRRKKLADFKQSAGGNYVYTGKLYTYSGTDLSRYIIKLCAAAFIDLAAAIAAGCLRVPGMINTFYVIVPYMFSVIASIMLAWACAKLAYWKDPLREYVYEATVEVLKPRAVFSIVSSGLTIILYIVNIVLNSFGSYSPILSVLFPILPLISLVSAVFLCKNTKKSLWN